MNKAQAKFIADDFVNKFNAEFNDVDPSTFNALEKVLFEFGLEFNRAIKRNLQRAAAINTGALLDIEIPFIQNKESLSVLNLGYPIGSKQDKYYDFINKGVVGVGGKNARKKFATGKYRFKSAKVGYFMANAIARWLANAKIKSGAERVPITRVEKKRAKLTAIVDAAKSKRKLSFAIARGIKRDGIKATQYVDQAINLVFNKEFREALEIALSADIIVQIKSSQPNGNNDNR
jgi:hypothetical protein